MLRRRDGPGAGECASVKSDPWFDESLIRPLTWNELFGGLDRSTASPNIIWMVELFSAVFDVTLLGVWSFVKPGDELSVQKQYEQDLKHLLRCSRCLFYNQHF